MKEVVDTAQQIDIRRLHDEYQEAYGMAIWRDQLAARESRFRGGMVHHDGRPVTLVNPEGDWGQVWRLHRELREARGRVVCPEHHFEHRKEESCEVCVDDAIARAKAKGEVA